VSDGQPKRGTVVRGTVPGIHNFGVFVRDVLSGPVVKLAPFGAFVRVAPGIAGLLHEFVLTRQPALGDIVTVTIAEVDRQRRRVRLEP
jgi:small subunit ribosomal protein S1